jgi:hypothetical protein
MRRLYILRSFLRSEAVTKYCVGYNCIDINLVGPGILGMQGYKKEYEVSLVNVIIIAARPQIACASSLNYRKRHAQLVHQNSPNF